MWIDIFSRDKMSAQSDREALATLLHRMAGKWTLDVAKSDSPEPLMAWMGMPWLIRKAVLAAASSGATVEIKALEDGFEVDQRSGMGTIQNMYHLGTDNVHKTPRGSFPATLTFDKAGDVLLLVVEVAGKGQLRTSYEVQDEGKRLVIVTGSKDFSVKRILNKS